MGTSSSQRSPSTPEWERVRELYRQPDPDPSQILSRIVSALEPDTKAGMSDSAVTCCLDSVLDGAVAASTGRLSEYLSDLPDIEQAPAVGLAGGIRDCAEERIIADNIASRFGDLALNAVGTTILSAAESAAGAGGILQVSYPDIESALAQYYDRQRMHELAGSFFAHDFDHVFRYFVARDISDFVGTEAIPDVSTSARLQDRIAHQCRTITGQLQLAAAEETIRQALANSDHQQRRDALQPFVRDTVNSGLDMLAAAGGAA
ncbi:MAG: hypothetical protein R6V19_12770 [Armatimonadota bacterium]